MPAADPQTTVDCQAYELRRPPKPKIEDDESLASKLAFAFRAKVPQRQPIPDRFHIQAGTISSFSPSFGSALKTRTSISGVRSLKHSRYSPLGSRMMKRRQLSELPLQPLRRTILSAPPLYKICRCRYSRTRRRGDQRACPDRSSLVRRGLTENCL